MGGKLFKIVGVISIVGILFQSYAVYFVLIPGILVAVYTVVYSYFEYKKDNVENGRKVKELINGKTDNLPLR